MGLKRERDMDLSPCRVRRDCGVLCVLGLVQNGQEAWWLLPGVLAIVLFAYLLARIEADAAGRAFAAYGGVYITASLGWLWIVEDTRPDRWDVLGASICLAGAAIILFAPRAA